MKTIENTSLFQRTKLRLVSRVLPMKTTGIVLVDTLEVQFKEATVNQIGVPTVPVPVISDDLSPRTPEIIASQTAIAVGPVEDLTPWLEQQITLPEIEFFPLLSHPPKRIGKPYNKSETESRQLSLFDSEEGAKKCVHGLTKQWCSICRQHAQQTKERTPSRIDPLDLIFPILQPPLGQDFDSPIAFPPGMELYAFQRAGVQFLLENDRALLSDEMGLGKSIQTIVALRCLFRLGRITSGLILCPKSVITDWERKLWDWAPELRLAKIQGTKEQREMHWNTPAHLYLATYESLRQDLAGSLEGGNGNRDAARKHFDVVVLDEVQKIKNPTANVTKATRLINAGVRWGLSGTPLENRLEELTSIYAYLKPNLLRYDDAARPWKVKEAIKPYFLRRRKLETLPDLPEKVHDEVWLDLTPSQREAYNLAEQEGIVALSQGDTSITVQHVLALITKLKQICNIDPLSKDSCKLEYLKENLEEVFEPGDKALVFSQYPKKTLESLEPALRSYQPLVYHGSLSDSKRDQIVTTFQESEENKVLLMSVKAGGLGLTLTRANYVYHFDLWWNPSVAAQAEDRAHRIGQKKTVFVTCLFTVDTIEERIERLLKRKRELFKDVIDDLSDTDLSKVLTDDELFGLFGLQKGPRSPKTTPRSKVAPPRIREITAEQFESLVADLYTKMGYHTKLTPPTRDQGVDVYARHLSDSGSEELAIQCKHYPNGVVGVDAARSLYGVIQAQPNITKGILLTSGQFSRECKEFAGGKRIELIDGTHLRGLSEKYGIPLF